MRFGLLSDFIQNFFVMNTHLDRHEAEHLGLGPVAQILSGTHHLIINL